MADNYQKEVPKARINITLDIETEGARKKKELPLKLLVLGDFTHGNQRAALAQRERINIDKHNFDKVLAELTPALNLSLPNTIKNDGSELHVSLQIQKYKDFHPDELIKQIPALHRLLAMRHLLKDLKANLIDNNMLRKELERLTKDKNSLLELQSALRQHAPLAEEALS